MKKVYLLALLLAPLAMQGQNIEKLQKKVAAGDTKAMVLLADHYEAGYGVPCDSARALELYRRAEKLGDKEALAHLGRYILYYSALGHDSAECYRLSKASAELRARGFGEITIPPSTETAEKQASRCTDCGVPFELHCFEDGHHGLGLGDGHNDSGESYPHMARWSELAAEWLALHGM